MVYKLIALALCFHTLIAQADELFVICHANTDTAALSKDQLANLYLDRANKPAQLIPFDQEDPQQREFFYRQTTGLSLASVRGYWAKRVFTGRGRPPAIIKPSQIQQTLEQIPNAIIYTDDIHQLQNAKLIFSLQTDQQP